MDYIAITANNYLEHHGILGQKWGVRRYQNKDGSLTEAGKKRRDQQFKEVVELYKKTRYDEDITDKVFKKLELDKNVLKDVKKDISEKGKRLKELGQESDEIFKELKNDNQNFDYWQATSEIADKLDRYGNFDKMTTDDMAWWIYLGIYEDGQQSPLNAYTAYAIENGNADKLQDIAKEYNKTENEIRDNSSKILSDEMNRLGDLSIEEIKTTSTWDPNTKTQKESTYTIKRDAESIGKSMVQRILNKDFDTPKSIYKAFDIVDVNNDKSKNAINQAKSIVANLGTNKNDRWENLNWALEEVGLDGIKCSDLTSSDWKKINDKLDELS